MVIKLSDHTSNSKSTILLILRPWTSIQLNLTDSDTLHKYDCRIIVLVAHTFLMGTGI